MCASEYVCVPTEKLIFNCCSHHHALSLAFKNLRINSFIFLHRAFFSKSLPCRLWPHTGRVADLCNFDVCIVLESNNNKKKMKKYFSSVTPMHSMTPM